MEDNSVVRREPDIRRALGPRPRYVQSAFALLLVADVVSRVVQHGPSQLHWPLLGAALALAMSVYVAILDPPPDGADLLAGIVSGLDIVFLGLTLMTPTDSKGSALVVLPCLWMGLRHGRSGAAVAGMLLLVSTVVLPRLPYGSAGVSVVEGLMLTLLGTVGALASDALARSAAAARSDAQEQLATLDAVIETADVSILVLDVDGLPLVHNRSGGTTLHGRAYPQGYPGLLDGPHEMYTGDGSRRLCNDERPEVRAARGEEFDGLVIAVGPDPATRAVASVSARQMRDAQGGRVGAVLTARDVTASVRAVRTRDDFIGAASHELRTPLASLMGFVHLLRSRTDLPAEAAADLEAVDRNVRRLGSLVDDLVHTAQVERPALDLVRRPADVADVVRRTVSELQHEASCAGAELSLEAPEHLTGNVDGPRIADALESLVRRALVRSPLQGVVRVRLAVEDERLEISVADDGAPIGPRDRDRLFRNETGAIDLRDAAMVSCKLVVESHGGRVETDPAAPGAVVRLRLPRGLTPSAAADIP